MGMVCELQALTPAQMEAICDDYDLAHKVVFPQEEDSETLAGEPLREQLYIDKCWDLLRFMMNKAGGQEEPDGDIWTGDILFADIGGAHDEVDAGYGPPYLRSVEATREFADFLSTLTVDQLLSHWNTEEMLQWPGVYLVSKEDDPTKQEERDRDLRNYAASHYPALREYVMQAAAAGCGLLLWIG